MQYNNSRIVHAIIHNVSHVIERELKNMYTVRL